MSESQIPELCPVQLASLGYEVPSSFILSIDSSETLVIHSVLRIVPNRRLVVKAKYQQIEVIVKIFFQHSRMQRAVEQEQAGYQILKNKGITTPEKIAELKSTDDGSVIFIYPYIDSSNSVDNPMFQLKVVERIVDMHNLAVIQDDMHLDNFILGENGIVWVIDPAAIKDHASIDQQLNNIALFIAQLPITDQASQSLLMVYLNQLYPGDSEKVLYVQALIQVKWKSRKLHYLKKIFRDCTEHKMLSSMNGTTLVRRSEYESLCQILENPESQLNSESILKDGNSATVFRVISGDKSWVVKRYKYKNFGVMLKRIVRTSRARRSWYFAHLMKMMGVATPLPVACIEKKILGFVVRSYYISEYVSGQDIYEAYTQDKNRLTPVIQELFYSWKFAKVAHGDLKATNFIYSNNNLYVIDFDGMKEFELDKMWRKAIDKDVSRLLRNWSDQNQVKVLQAALDNV